MIIVLREDATQARDRPRSRQRIRELGLKAAPQPGRTSHHHRPSSATRQRSLLPEPLQAIAGVEQVMPVMKPYKMASREYQKKLGRGDTIVVVGKRVKIGGGNLAMIAGPCAIEGREILDDIAGKIKKAGANILIRGGAFEPRTSPYSFQGLGEEGLQVLRRDRHKHDMPVVTEVMDPRSDLALCSSSSTRTCSDRRPQRMQNFDLLKELGQTKLPVLMKRGMSATVKDLLMSAEYILSEGIERLVLCERGVRTFESRRGTCSTWPSVPNVKGPRVICRSSSTRVTRPAGPI